MDPVLLMGDALKVACGGYLAGVPGPAPGRRIRVMASGERSPSLSAASSAAARQGPLNRYATLTSPKCNTSA